MRLASLLKWAGGAAAILVAGAAAFLLSVDIGSYREEIAAEFRKATGRSLTIGGDMELSISLNPAIAVERVAIANAGWGSRPVMAAVARVEAEVALLPLLAGDIRVSRLVLIEPDILLETNADGLSNWRPAPPAGGRSGAPAGPAAADGEGKADSAPAAPAFAHVEIRRGRLAYRDARTGTDIRLDLERLSAEAEPFGAPLQLEAAGAWNGHPFSVSGAVGPLPTLASGQPARLALAADALGFRARFAGAVAGPARPDALDLRVAVRGADLSSLAPLAGPGLPQLGPAAFEARIRGGAGRFTIEEIEAALAGSDLSGRVELALAAPRPRLYGRLEARVIDLAELRRRPAGSGRPAASGGGGAKRAGKRPDRIFPDDPLPLDGLKAVDLDLALGIGKLAGLAVPVSAVEARIRLDKGALEVRPFRAAVAGSPVEGALGLDAGRAMPGLRIAARADGFDLGRLLEEAGVTDLFEGRAKARIDLSGSGRSVAALMAGLDGDIGVVGGRGRLKTQALDAAAGGASALLGALLQGRRQWAVVNCAVVSVGIEKGRATGRAVLIDTEYSTVAARGAADLASETLDLVVEPRAKAATLTIAVPVRIRGRFTEPEFRPETGAALKKLGGLAAAALFPPAALLGLGEPGAGGRACLEAAAAGPQAGAPPPEQAVRELRDNLKGAVKDLGRGLKGLFRRKQD